MTLSIKIKNVNQANYAARVERDGSVVARLQPQEEAEVTLWDHAPLTITEEPAAVVKAAE